MMSMRSAFRLAALLLPLALSGAPATAQTDDPALEPAVEPAAKPKKAKDQSDLEARVQQLERQMLDMQVVIGTLESMSRQGGAAGSGGALGSDAEARLAALETQLQALAAEVRELGGRTVSSTSVAPSAATPDAGDFAATTPDESNSGGDTITIDGGLSAPSTDAIGTMLENGDQTAAATTDAPLPDSGTAGTTSKEGIDASDLGTLDGTDPAASAAAGETDVAALPAAGTPEEAYEEAYGHLLQQDYEAAEGGFKAFLKAYPKSKLAGNAQYWLGESYYVRGNYKQAADAFLTGYKNHRKSQKAPDSLMKLAMSLSRLGEKEASCSAFAALESDFPKLQPQLLRRAQSEKQRAGC